MSKEKHSDYEYEQKFIDFLLENNIDIDLIIAGNKEEYFKLSNLIKECKFINIKTLMPYTDLKVDKTSDDINLIHKSISLRKRACMKEDKVMLTEINCRGCGISTIELCAFNGVYKTDGIIKKGE